jgi:predicted secreted protein
MGVGSIIAIYFVVWWVVLFAVLPFGVRTQQEEGDIVLGTVHSAPIRPMMVRKVIVTSLISAAIVFLIWLAVDVFGFGLETLAELFDLRQ